MFKKIIVPLDGSILAEKALPYAANLTRQLNANLVLLRVEEAQPLVVEFSPSYQIEAGNVIHAGNIQPNNQGNRASRAAQVPDKFSTKPYQAISSYIGQQDDEDYLQNIKRSLVGLDAANSPLRAEQIQTLVVCGRSPKELDAIVKEEEADLVVMTTHGRSGWSFLLTGSIATNLIHKTSVPVILIKPEDTLTQVQATDQELEGAETRETAVNLDPIVVALDGTSGAETILDAATNLALQLGVKIHLFEVVTTIIPGGVAGGIAGYYSPEDYNLDKERSLGKEQAAKYLKKIQARLKEKGVDCDTVVQNGEPVVSFEFNLDPITRIMDYSRRVKAQLVAMTTHGRGHLGQVLLGSRAEVVVRETHLPVLLMRKVEPLNHPTKN